MADGMERRDFLKVLGVAGAGAGLSGCSSGTAEKLIPYVVPPEDIVPGMATWYRTTCRECPAGCGMNVRTREGRAVKAEGNSLSPISHGKLCARGQASLQGLYDPDRVPQPLMRESAVRDWQTIGWDAAERRLAALVTNARGRAVFLTGATSGSEDALLDEWCAAAGVRRVRYDSFGLEPIRAAYRMMFGVDGIPVHDFANADVVISFGADFLETWISPVDYAHGFVEGHAYAGGRRGRLISVGPHQSLTGLNADEWLAVRSGSEALVALAMARLITDAGGGGDVGPAAGIVANVDVDAAAEAAGVPVDRIAAAAREFARDGRSLAVGPGVGASHRNATAVAAAVAILNAAAGNIGRTIHLDRLEAAGGADGYVELQRLLQQMQAGQVSLLLVHGTNPLYSLPEHETFAEAMRGLDGVVSFSPYMDETSAHAHMILPDHHFLESWGDAEPRTGVHSIVQPVMLPVFETKQTEDVLLSVARRAGVALPNRTSTFYDYLRNRWRQDVMPQVGGGAGGFDDWWREALQQGTVVAVQAEAGAGAQAPGSAVGLAGLSFEMAAFDSPGAGGDAAGQDAEADEEDDDTFHLVVYPSYRFYDGRMANRPWLQELPDPVSKISWTSWVEVHPNVADRLGLDDGHVVDIATRYGRTELPIWRHPGIREDTIAVQLGQGHERFGRYAMDRGVNAIRLLGPVRDEASGGFAWQQTRATLRPTGEWERLPATGRLTEGGRDVMKTVDLDEARAADVERGIFVGGLTGSAAEAAHAGAAPAAGQEAVEENLTEQEHGSKGGGGHQEVHPYEAEVTQLNDAGGFAPITFGAGPADYPSPGTYYGEYSEGHPRWAMAIDLDRCIGCSACMTACYAENNIGMVGPDLVANGRIMHWIRIERYFPEVGGGEGGGAAGEEGTAESAEGTAGFLPMLCQQCGQAPCEAVCPVYAAYHTPDGLNAQIYNRCVGTRYCANNCPYKVRYMNWFTWAWPEPLNWQLNPDVTVREKGVMEKCTFCVQRIRESQHNARLEGRGVPDGEITPACAQTCPGNAITFGDIKDPASRVARIAASGRGYRVLDHLNTQSGITYLKKVVPGSAEA